MCSEITVVFDLLDDNGISDVVSRAASAGFDEVLVRRTSDGKAREVVIRNLRSDAWAESVLARALDVVAVTLGTSAEKILQKDRAARGDLAGHGSGED